MEAIRAVQAVVSGEGRSEKLAVTVRWVVRVGLLLVLAYTVAVTPPGLGTHGLAGLNLLGLLVGAVGWLGWGALRDRESPLRLIALPIGVAGGALLVPGTAGSDVGVILVCLVVLAAASALEPGPAGVLAVVAIVALALAERFWDNLLPGGFAVLAVAVSYLGGIVRRQRKLHLAQTELLLVETQVAKEEQARAAALDERARIAREIHDVLAHSLGGLLVQLEAADALLEKVPGAEKARSCVVRARSLAGEGLTETRRAVSALRGDKRSLPEFLTTLVADYQADLDVPVTLDLPAEQVELRPEVTLALQRLSQEAMTNVRRHAPGAPVAVSLSVDGGWVELVVHNGEPTAVEHATTGGGYGLIGMRERIEQLSGTLDAAPEGRGWTIRTRVPQRTEGD
ncbi:sensor histidine kinase [Kibdelosporangium aridum]|uniref:histidine kinase n=1 Tax=Kibdelosporangium aridum TaxID=2030 RepID=A0A1W2G033_KIBAR|nr:histidine kinase [Kibdelosporangium aridum]SMD27384.1 Signal transduction histidine kinase [Kibdelosporangium aridum]